MTVFVSMSPQTIYMSGLDPHADNMDIPVRVLDCDTITQVQEGKEGVGGKNLEGRG